MRIAGTGFTTFDVDVVIGYRPQTTLSINWFQTESRQWRATDRGADADVYESGISLKGKESDIDAFIDAMNLNRTANSNIVTLSNFSAGEKIFGANVDHSSTITATIISIDKKVQVSWKGFGVSARLRASLPAFVGATGPLPLNHLNIGFVADSETTIKKMDSYTGAFSYLDGVADSGRFQGYFTLTATEMATARNFIRTTRATTFSVASIGGVAQIFGKRRGAYPFNVNVVEWEDLGQRDMAASWWVLRLVLAEAFS